MRLEIQIRWWQNCLIDISAKVEVTKESQWQAGSIDGRLCFEERDDQTNAINTDNIDCHSDVNELCVVVVEMASAFAELLIMFQTRQSNEYSSQS